MNGNATRSTYALLFFRQYVVDGSNHVAASLALIPHT